MKRFLFILVLAFFISGCPGDGGSAVDEIMGVPTSSIVDDGGTVDPADPVVLAESDMDDIENYCVSKVEAPNPDDDNRFLCTAGVDSYFRDIENKCSSAKHIISCVDDGTGSDLSHFVQHCRIHSQGVKCDRNY